MPDASHLTARPALAEAAVLHWIMYDRWAREHALGALSDSDFQSLLAAEAFRAVRTLHRRGAPVYVEAVAEAMRCDTEMLASIAQRPPLSDLDAVRLVREASQRRTIAAAAEALALDARNPDVDVERLHAWRVADLHLPALALPEPLPSLEAVIAEHVADVAHDWLIPGVIERGDRAMVVAPEGQGKSWLLRQWAWQTAAGIHWWTGRNIEPRRVLIVDAENSIRQIARGSGRMLFCARTHSADWQADRLKLVCEPNLDLTLPSYRDRIEGHLEIERPDLLVIGPLYKAFATSARLSYEENAMLAASIIDDWRSRYGVAVLLEHHAAKAASGSTRVLDPVGSSVWLRWPEFGLTLGWSAKHAAYRVGRFRGDREQREWPQWMTRSAEPHNWPWRPHLGDLPDGPGAVQYDDNDAF